MKKNAIIFVLLGLLISAIYIAHSYRKLYIEWCKEYQELQNEALADSTAEEEKYPLVGRKIIPYNYLMAADVDSDAVCSPCDPDVPSMFPEKGVSRIMAARIAEAVLYSQFKGCAIQCRPYSVLLYKGRWIVDANNSGERIGNFYMEIDQDDGRIVKYRL